MSLQAIAGIAFDRRNSDSPSRAAAMRIEAAAADPTPKNESQAAAQKVNSALETLKRYIPTEVLALYLPFVAIAGGSDCKGNTRIVAVHLWRVHHSHASSRVHDLHSKGH